MPVELAGFDRWQDFRFEPTERRGQWCFIGSADVGQRHWCDAQALFSQRVTELGYANRALKILATKSNLEGVPVAPHPAVIAATTTPISTPPPADAPRWAQAEWRETQGLSGASFVAEFRPFAGLPPASVVWLVGVLDGLEADGTVVEVACNGFWRSWRAFESSGEHRIKTVQANIYATLLGTKRWKCVWYLRGERHELCGDTDVESAMSELTAALRTRFGLESPQPVSPENRGRCRSCRYPHECPAPP